MYVDDVFQWRKICADLRIWGRALQHQLKLIKANNIGTAKSQWYDWKLQWVEQLYESASQGFANLEQVILGHNASFTSDLNIVHRMRPISRVLSKRHRTSFRNSARSMRK